MALLLNPTLRGAILDAYRTTGTAASDVRNSRWTVYLYDNAITPYPANAPTTMTGYNNTANYSWRSVGTTYSDTATIQFGRSGDVLSIAAGSLSNNANQTSAITWALFQSVTSTSAIFITDSVGLADSSAIVKLSSLSAVSGQPLSIVSISLRMIGA
jgi:hypothetical protein